MKKSTDITVEDFQPYLWPIVAVIVALIIGGFLYAALHESPKEACEKRGGTYVGDGGWGGDRCIGD